jgi:hypothetical protein
MPGKCYYSKALNELTLYLLPKIVKKSDIEKYFPK